MQCWRKANKKATAKGGFFVADGGTAGIEPATFNALSVLEMSHKVYGAISANTPSVIGWLWTLSGILELNRRPASV